ncbi:phosphatidylserine decarboxylase [Candidatus Viridilinea mediisalina]|uniref:Ribosomal RNA adenine methylase transferase N-terminal domain-containing protein n=1 Tax=Candidatus Viridilinea mediisalina TaxID=2024553 RepID=A0A2A6RIG1_9CHLR|nr:phosphatidylserine decarboxylase [Candidatus Viridilinea mediisalina]PDW02686.1 hypothetical protein CJ255_12565 [Candidatus Viridilinea mediisalina]
MSVQESLYFLRNLQGSFTSIGALLPTSLYAARAMAAEFARRVGPRTVLEVGAGTGAITRAIVEHMGPEDRLVVYELNEEFVTFLRQRFEHDPLFRRVRDQVTIVQGDVTLIDRSQRFDHIISAIPFTNLPAKLVEAILDCYRTILKPDGTLTYIEYAYLRALKHRFMDAEQRLQVDAANAVLDPMLERHEFRRDTVLRNAPPAWIHHLRFVEPQVAEARNLRPLEHARRVELGPSGLSTEALPWLFGLLTLALLPPLRRARPYLALLAAGIGHFFRDPPRRVMADTSAIYAACDGRVLTVERLHDERFGQQEWLRIAVFLALNDVHINRSPVAGKVERLHREHGGFAPADAADAEHNNALYTTIQGPRGRVIVAQRSGLVARRIVTWVEPGTLVAQGERYGLIRFGSRTDVYIPADSAEPLVRPGDRVVGGETLIARYR